MIVDKATERRKASHIFYIKIMIPNLVKSNLKPLSSSFMNIEANDPNTILASGIQ